MTNEKVSIDRRALATLAGDYPPDHPYMVGARHLAAQALNATRTDEEIMRDGVAAHVRRYCNEERVLSLKVFPRTERDSSGMLEWILRYEWETGGGITIGMIQRAPGAPVEYCS